MATDILGREIPVGALVLWIQASKTTPLHCISPTTFQSVSLSGRLKTVSARTTGRYVIVTSAELRTALQNNPLPEGLFSSVQSRHRRLRLRLEREIQIYNETRRARANTFIQQILDRIATLTINAFNPPVILGYPPQSTHAYNIEVLSLPGPIQVQPERTITFLNADGEAETIPVVSSAIPNTAQVKQKSKRFSKEATAIDLDFD